MEPKEFDLEFPRGDTCPLEFSISDSAGNILTPQEGDELCFTLKKNYKTKDAILQKKFSQGDFEIEDEIIRFFLYHEDTAELKYGTYYYDIQLESGDYVKTILKGSIELTEEATWLENE